MLCGWLCAQKLVLFEIRELLIARPVLALSRGIGLCNYIYWETAQSHWTVKQ